MWGSVTATVLGLALGSRSGSESDLVLVLRSGWVPAMAMLSVSGSAIVSGLAIATAMGSAMVSGLALGSRSGSESDLVLVSRSGS